MHSDDSKDKRSRASSSTRMLMEVLDGRTYESVALDFGVTRTAVEKRVKRLAIRLARGTGIEGVNEGSVNFIGRLRTQRGAVLDALQRFDPDIQQVSEPPRVLTAEEVALATSRIRARSPQWKRDVAMLYMLFATGARPIEIARLEVRDYLGADGHVRRQSELRPEASVFNKARPLYFSSSRLDGALTDYLAERLEHRLGAGGDGAYRGLQPESRLFLTPEGEGFELTRYGANQRRLLCSQILLAYRKIFRWAELNGATPLSVRHTLVARLYGRGADEEQVGLVLGINDRWMVREMFPRARPTMAQLVEDLV